MFVDPNLSVCPDIYPVCSWVDDCVPDLSDVVCVPFAKWLVELLLVCGGVASAQYLSPCGPNGGSWGCLMGESVYGCPGVALSSGCPFADGLSIAGADVG